MNSGINVLSCFDGMSCAQIALERAGIKVNNYYASEVDKWSIKVTQENYPQTQQIGDINKLCGAYMRDCYIDLLIGGSPCQDLSRAGKGKGLDGERSGLFWEYVRLKNELQPRWFLLENVRMKQEYQDIISEALGVQPVRINSNLVSAQNRDRYYWTNIPFAGMPEDKGVLLKDILEDRYVTDRDKSYCLDANYFKGGNLKSYFTKNRRQLVFTPDSFWNGYLEHRKLTPIECERLQTVPDNYTQSVSNTQRYKMLGNGFTVDVIAHLLKGMLVR